jgi:hypothetical protein
MRRFWAPDEIDLVMEYYEFLPTSELAELLDRTVLSVYNLSTKLGLHKSPELVAEMARQKILASDHPARRTQFRKGNVPHNKGKRMPGWSVGRMRETQFKKGQVSINWMPIGATRKIDGYLYRKISDVRNVPHTVNWRPEHILRWEKKYGPVPEGFALAFKDGNRDNIRLSNLEAISRAELMLRNTVHNLPEPLKEVIRLKGSIKRVITCRRRKYAGNKK